MKEQKREEKKEEKETCMKTVGETC